MQIAIVSKFKNAIKSSLLSKYGLRIGKRPEVVICMGGEGTLLYGELIWPGVPKLFIKHKCKDGCRHDMDSILQKLASRSFSVKEMLKLEASVGGDETKRLIGLNDINIHYKMPCAIGLDVMVGKRKIKNVLGDGVIIATPYGSTAYFRSIARKTFVKGIGIAFNNPVRPVKPFVVSERSMIKVRITKGSGWMAADSNTKLIPIKAGDVITVRPYARPAKIIKLSGYPLKISI